MYNDIIIIFICTFAIYGIYAFLREVCMLFMRKKRVVAAIRVGNDISLREEKIANAERLIDFHYFLERKPVLLCDIEGAKENSNYGYDVYIKYTEDS